MKNDARQDTKSRKRRRKRDSRGKKARKKKKKEWKGRFAKWATPCTKDACGQLWLPTAVSDEYQQQVDSDPQSSAINSWRTLESLRERAEEVVGRKTDDNNRVKCFKVPITLSGRKQGQVLRKYAQAYAKTWNLSLDAFRRKEVTIPYRGKFHRVSVTKEAVLRSKRAAWLLDVPCVIRKYANFHLETAFKIMNTMRRKQGKEQCGREGCNGKCTVKFKNYRRTRRNGCFEVEKECANILYHQGDVYLHIAGRRSKSTRLSMTPFTYRGRGSKLVSPGLLKLKLTRRSGSSRSSKISVPDGVILPSESRREMKPLCDFKLKCEEGRWFAILPYEIPAADEQEPAPLTKTVSIDPGVRVFGTLYAPEQRVAQEIHPPRSRLKGLWRSTEKVTSKMRELRSAAADTSVLLAKRRRLALRAKNVCRQFHHDAASRLVQQYDHILLPVFNSNCVKNVSEETKWVSDQLQHGKFRAALLQRVCNYPSKRLWRSNEVHTTIMCGRCGVLNKVGPSEVYVCGECGLSAGRDLNAARNIYIKFFTGAR